MAFPFSSQPNKNNSSKNPTNLGFIKSGICCSKIKKFLVRKKHFYRKINKKYIFYLQVQQKNLFEILKNFDLFSFESDSVFVIFLKI